jgi:D-3-phosphoglycerate dehydrogenase
MHGQQIGIVGFGKIGQAVGKRAQAFGMQVVAYDPYISAEAAEKQHVKLVDLDTLLTTSDVISIHMNLTKENTAFFTLDVFKKMVKKPFIINVARGAMIDEKDLVTALDTNLVRGAGLDVLESEYPDMKTCPLVGRPNVILTPHSAFYSKTAEFLSAKITVENLVKCLKGNFKGAARVVNDVGLYI